MNLSSDDLGMFFEPAHTQLAAALADTRNDIEAANRSGDARVMARELGRMGFYRWLLPDAQHPGRAANDPPRALPAPTGHHVDVRALCLARELLGYVSPLADAIFAVQGLFSYPILVSAAGRHSPEAGDTGSEDLARLLSACRAGSSIGGFALTEPDAGSDVASMKTVAEQRSPGSRRYLLNGEKTLISNVGVATHYVVFANADPDAGRRGITAFLVPAGSPGLRETPIALNIDHPIGALSLEDCEATPIGDVGHGFELAMHTLDTFRVTVGAAAVGMARRALDEAIAHVSTRVQFGKPLSRQQLVQSHVADMATELDAARLLVMRAAHARDTAAKSGTLREMRSTLGKHAAMAKLYATEAAQRIVDQAVQLLGGRGVRAGEVVENLYRAIRPLRIYEGTSEIQRIIIGRAVTGSHGSRPG